MIKILFVQHCSAIGGGSWCLYEILRHLDRDRFEPVVLLCEQGPLADRIRSLNIPVTVLPTLVQFPVYERGQMAGQILGMLGLIKKIFAYPKSFRAFYNFCRACRPDVVHLNSLALLTLPWPAKKSGVKTVLLHNREHWEPKGVLRVKNLLKNWIVGRFVDHVLSITECGIRHIGFPGKSSVVRDWPSFDAEASLEVRKELGIDPGRFLILVPGGMQSIKGTLDVLQALTYVQNLDQVAVVVLGCREIKPVWWKTVYTSILSKGMYAYRIVRWASRYAQVFLLPSTFQVKSYMAASDLVICPFRFPHAAKAALEAQCMDKPVLLYDNEEAREYVQQEETGLIVPCADIRRLASMIDDLIMHPQKAKQLGRNGRVYVSSRFSKETSLAKLSAAFENREWDCITL